ncbi:MAG: FecR domain-containing protein [Bacteroidota bacterium]
MQKDFENIDALIAKFHAGETNPEENAFLEDWKRESAENDLYFKASIKFLNSMAGFKDVETVDVNAAWEKLDKRISAGAKIIPISGRKTFVWIAASLLLLVSLGFVFTWFFDETASSPLCFKATASITEEILPDGSKVFMRKNSEISYLVNKEGQREVILKGEAFFEVVHDEKNPFVVNVNDVMIRDIGTAFNVKDNQAVNSIEVLVESGEVLFFSENNPGLQLVKGEKAVYNKTTKQFARVQVNPSENTTSYKSKIFEFRETRLREVVTQLNEAYGCNIRLGSEAIGEQHLSVVFNNENPELIINIIAETLDLEVEKRGDSVLFKSKSVSN